MLVLPLFLASANTLAATYRNAVICHDCSFGEAESLIKQRAAPALECISSDPNQHIGIDNQMCRSNPVQSVVINATTQEVFGFTVSHLNQGGTPRTMTPNAVSFVVPALAKRLAVDSLNYYATIQNVMADSADAFNRTVAPTGLSVASTGGCASDGDAKAMRAALDEQQIAALQREVNNHFNANFSATENSFLNARFNGLSFDVARDGYGISGSWEHLPASKILQQYYLQSGNREAAKVTYLLSWRDGVYVNVHDEQTYIGGYRLSSLKNNNGQRMLLSPCVAEALEELYGDNLSIESPSGSDSTGGDGSVDGGGFGVPGIGGGSGGYMSECEVHLYDKNGNEIMNFMIPC
ncbi:hypothetical protein [Rheinheimera maricola]|uniref:hypothetical protein n=1 Tax=Rheinheimera maricola TaxID=2793282 RepID=UPI00196619AD|nr:hypothetical protein [Rheinheimera maricola]